MDIGARGFGPEKGADRRTTVLMDVIEKRRAAFDRWVDFASVLLISAATVLTAWCGYEAARWTALQTRMYNTANADRVLGAVDAAQSNTLKTIDVAMFLRYIATLSEKRTPESDFIYQRFRPEMKAAVDAWIKTKPLKNPHAPSTPFAMPQYRVALDDKVSAANAAAAKAFEAGENANDQADSYVRLTVIFAAVSFLAGISTRFVFPNHIFVTIGGFAMLIFGLFLIHGLPIR